MEKSSPVGLRHIAAKAGVSIMTVSRVMRGSRRVSPETRERIERLAEEFKYRPDPISARLMSVVRKGKQKRIGATMALVRVRTRQPVPDRSLYRYVETADVRLRAELHGYGLDEFLLGPGELSGERLQSVLRARDIEGVLFSIETSLGEIENFDFARFACATFGYALKKPALHRASTNMMQGLLSAFETLTTRGYRRLGLVITAWIDERAEYTYTGAMLHHQAGIPRARRVPSLVFRGESLSVLKREYCRWFRQHRPDIVITFDRYAPEWTRQDLGLRIPEDVGFVVHDWTETAGRFSGLSHNRTHVAAAAVDLVATQLFHGEFGVPVVPRQVLIPATWVESPSSLVRQEGRSSVAASTSVAAAAECREPSASPVLPASKLRKAAE